MAKKNRKYQGNKITRGAPPNYLGQHLLHNKKLINEIVDHAKIRKHDVVLDLGAGKGALTTVLSEKAKKVLAVEYDRKFTDVLERKFKHHSNVKVIHRDILQLSLPRDPFVVVSNIPYAITTPILKKLLNKPSSNFQRGVIVMEKGAAKRFTADFVKDPYVIAWRMWFDIRFVKGISRKYFSPPPRVDAAIVVIHRKAEPIVPYRDYLVFWGLADYMLQHPSVSIDDALRGVFTVPQIKRLKRNLRINSDVPVGALSVQQWGMVYDTMVKYVPQYRWPKLKKATFKSLGFR